MHEMPPIIQAVLSSRIPEYMQNCLPPHIVYQYFIVDYIECPFGSLENLAYHNYILAKSPDWWQKLE